MAQILPGAPVGLTTPERLRAYHLLRRLPDEEYYVWQRLAIWPEPGPDFWVAHRDGRAILLKVSSATPGDVQASQQPALFGPAAVAIGRDEMAALADFLARLTPNPDSMASPIPTGILFPNLSAASLKKVTPADLPAGQAWLAKENLTPDAFAAWLAGYLQQPLTRLLVAALRRAFTPEVIIPPTFTVRPPAERGTTAGLSSLLLDYNQERVLKTDLDLSAEAQGAAHDFGLRLVNGVAGSGKSLIIVYRARLLRRFFPDKQILVLTHNRPLIRDLLARYRELGESDRNVRWHTFMSWCWRHRPASVSRRQVVKQRLRRQLITQAWHAHLADTAISEPMLQDEIDWLKDRLIFGREEYVTADRAGRGFALAEPMRHKLYDAMETYHKALRQRGLLDWADIPRQLWLLIQSGKAHLPLYDAILVDEAQFFAPLWFEIIKKLLKPGSGHLFLVADPSQGFLRRRQSWLATGLDVRGRAHRLNKSYRTTREILDFATLLYRTRLPDDDEGEEIVAPNLLDMPTGAVPVVVPLTSPQDELTRVVNEIRALVAAGIPLGHILVIHADRRETARLTERLCRALGPAAAVDPGAIENSRGHIRVCSLHAATGLEAPIVFLMGVHALYQEEQSVRLSDSERAELIRDNTRKLYMACTRAGQRLVLTYVGDVPELLQKKIGPGGALG
jgi:hypothetical protein